MSNFRIPKSFKIKDKTWTVKFERGGDVDGWTNQVSRTITLRAEVSREEKWELFMHEFIHAALYEIHISGPANVLSSDLEEIIATGLADVLSSTFILDWQEGRAKGGITYGKKKPTEEGT